VSEPQDFVVNRTRVDYGNRTLERADLDDDPIVQFERWLAEAATIGLQEPNAMTLATVGLDNQPSVRTVLLRHVDHSGFVFFTNYQGRKAQQLSQNNRAALLFHWQVMHRQISIEGVVEKISRDESAEYFASRPRESQLGAWASPQSHTLESRAQLDDRFADEQRRFDGVDVELPEFWGGYRLTPMRIEFWQGRSNRLHDRFVWLREAPSRPWAVERLAP
jgi:pyridoxamine 5'-phosphate oxidase